MTGKELKEKLTELGFMGLDICHTAVEYIDSLEKIVDRLPKDANGFPVLIGEEYVRPGKGDAAGTTVSGVARVDGPIGFHMGEPPEGEFKGFVGSTWKDCVPVWYV